MMEVNRFRKMEHCIAVSVIETLHRYSKTMIPGRIYRVPAVPRNRAELYKRPPRVIPAMFTQFYGAGASERLAFVAHFEPLEQKYRTIVLPLSGMPYCFNRLSDEFRKSLDIGTPVPLKNVLVSNPSTLGEAAQILAKHPPVLLQCLPYKFTPHPGAAGLSFILMLIEAYLRHEVDKKDLPTFLGANEDIDEVITELLERSPP